MLTLLSCLENIFPFCRILNNISFI